MRPPAIQSRSRAPRYVCCLALAILLSFIAPSFCLKSLSLDGLAASDILRQDANKAADSTFEKNAAMIRRVTDLILSSHQYSSMLGTDVKAKHAEFILYGGEVINKLLQFNAKLVLRRDYVEKALKLMRDCHDFRNEASMRLKSKFGISFRASEILTDTSH